MKKTKKTSRPEPVVTIHEVGGNQKGFSKYGFSQMEPGKSYLIPTAGKGRNLVRSRRNVHVSAHLYAGRTPGYVFHCRTEKAGVRVYRLS